MNYKKWIDSGFAFKQKHAGLVDRLITPVSIFSISMFSTNQKENKTEIVALWDTGANTTCIDTKVAEHLNLIPTGKATVSTANGINRVNTYSFILELPGNFKIRVLNATGGDLGHPNLSMLIGMDIILQGDFFYGQNEQDGKPYSYFSFSIPSIGRNIDFAEDLRKARNPSGYSRVQTKKEKTGTKR